MIERMTTLRELIELGFSPMVALVIAGLIVLWGALCAVVVAMYRANMRERKDRDALRDAWKAEVDSRLKLAESKNDECDRDRDRLQGDLTDLRGRVARFEKCPRANCPMRLPG